jgi:hypothetical protein
MFGPMAWCIEPQPSKKDKAAALASSQVKAALLGVLHQKQQLIGC